MMVNIKILYIKRNKDSTNQYHARVNEFYKSLEEYNKLAKQIFSFDNPNSVDASLYVRLIILEV